MATLLAGLQRTTLFQSLKCSKSLASGCTIFASACIIDTWYVQGTCRSIGPQRGWVGSGCFRSTCPKPPQVYTISVVFVMIVSGIVSNVLVLDVMVMVVEEVILVVSYASQ